MLKWTDPSWRNDAEAWIRERVADAGYSLVAPLEHAHVRPWGTAIRVPTDQGVLWFKANIPPLAYEVPLTLEIAARRPDCVPRIVAADARRGWLLLEDSGAIVADLYDGEPPLEVWEALLPMYAQLQIDVAPAAPVLVAAGVPDRGLPNLIAGLRRVLENDRLVRPAADAALTDDELEQLHSLTPQLEEAIETLAALELPDSVHHDDVHQWNVCVRDGAYRIIDWGDACIGHPLLSLWVPIEHMEAEYVEAARGAYLEPWTALRAYDDLVAACDAALLTAQITGVLKWELITSALSDEERGSYLDVVPQRLRCLLELACA
jgi:hypothetical protein